MYTIDDPMLALILRFVGHSQEIDFCDHDFIQEQLKTIQNHIEGFPPAERKLRAIEWIEKYAREYRESKVKEVLGEMFSSQRCPDCPLSEVGIPRYCRIHGQWLGLLQQYSAEEIDARVYVEKSLKLLAEHKESLKANLSMLSVDRSSRPLRA